MPSLPGDHGQAGLAHRPLGRRLGAHQLHHVRRRADEADAVDLTEGGEAGVLREEAPARVEGRAAALDGRLHDLGRVEVAQRGAGGAEDDLLPPLEVGGVGVGGGDPEDRRDAEGVAAPSDARGHLAAVGDEEAMKEPMRASHGGRRLPWIGPRVTSARRGLPATCGTLDPVDPSHLAQLQNGLAYFQEQLAELERPFWHPKKVGVWIVAWVGPERRPGHLLVLLFDAERRGRSLVRGARGAALPAGLRRLPTGPTCTARTPMSAPGRAPPAIRTTTPAQGPRGSLHEVPAALLIWLLSTLPLRGDPGPRPHDRVGPPPAKEEGRVEGEAALPGRAPEERDPARPRLRRQG